MSDWIKTQNGWSQTSGNVDYSEIDALKSSFAQLHTNNMGDATNIQVNTSFTCPSDGFVIFGSYTTVTSRMVINNIAMDFLIINSQLSTTMRKAFRVFKDDVVYIAQDSGTVSVHEFRPIA